MTEEIIKCVKGESCIHCGSTYCRFVDEVNELKQENKELKKQHYEALKMLKHEYNSRQRDNEQWFTRCTENHNEDSKIIEKYRSALEEIKSIIVNNNSMLIDKKDYLELQCGEPIAFKLQKICNKINEVLS